MRCTVAVPLYNKASTVRRCLDSIRAQTLADFEVFVVDDGSTDSSAAQVERFLAESADPRFHYVRQENAGPGAARNHAIRLGSSPLAAFLDADDEWMPQHLEVCAAALDQTPQAAVAASSWFYEPGHQSSDSIFREFSFGPGIHRMSPHTKLSQLMGLMVFLMPRNTMVRRDVFLSYGGYREHRCRYAEDTYLYLPLALNFETVVLGEATSYFHRDASELSGNYTKARPVEPFLEDAATMRARCPGPLLPLLERFLAARAMKTACMLSFWGHWREGVALRDRFGLAEAAKLPWYWPSRLACNPIGSAAGFALRKAQGMKTALLRTA